MKALKEEVAVKKLDIASPFTPVDTTWLATELSTGETLGEALTAGLAVVTKEDEGEIFQKWNQFIVNVVAVIPELKAHITVRKTKKRVSYYGISHDLWNALKNGSTTPGDLPAL